jgi:hypothetical protein
MGQLGVDSQGILDHSLNIFFEVDMSITIEDFIERCKEDFTEDKFTFAGNTEGISLARPLPPSPGDEDDDGPRNATTGPIIETTGGERYLYKYLRSLGSDKTLNEIKDNLIRYRLINGSEQGDAPAYWKMARLS